MTTITDFENGPYYESLWGGATSYFDIQTGTVYSGTYAAEIGESSALASPHAISTRAFLVDRGSVPISAYLNVDELSDEHTFLFGVQSVTGWNSMSCYGLRHDELNGIHKIIKVTDGSVTELASVEKSVFDGWVEFTIDTWDSSGDIAGTIGGESISGTDSNASYSSGGIGMFTNGDNLWLDNVTADSFTDNRFAAPTNVSITES